MVYPSASTAAPNSILGRTLKQHVLTYACRPKRTTTAMASSALARPPDREVEHGKMIPSTPAEHAQAIPPAERELKPEAAAEDEHVNPENNTSLHVFEGGQVMRTIENNISNPLHRFQLVRQAENTLRHLWAVDSEAGIGRVKAENISNECIRA